MQLDNIIIGTRLRSGWAAIDLGFALARRFWLTAVAVYLVPALLMYAITRSLAEVYVWLPYLILWWCKPMFERPILCLTSRELFSEPMSFVNIMRAYKSWLLPSMLAVLTTRRLSFYRGMTAPIGLLEGTSGAAYRERANILTAKVSSQAFWLNIVLVHVEALIALGALVLLEVLLPDAIELSVLLTDTEVEMTGYRDLATLLVMAMVAPFYVMAGFMLYITRRVELEGWDIEIAFRDWARQQQRNAIKSDSMQTDLNGRRVGPADRVSDV